MFPRHGRRLFQERMPGIVSMGDGFALQAGNSAFVTQEAPLRIRLLGGVELRWHGRKLPPFPTHKSKSLFSFLVLNRDRRHPRDVLAGAFWGERPDRIARNCLRTDIWRMRKLVEADARESGDYLHVDRHEVGFRSESAHWLDIQSFEALLGDSIPRNGSTLPRDRAAALEEAVGLYRGDLLEGIYEDWLVFERERLRELLLMALDRLMEYHGGREAWSEAITHGQRLLGIDPLREHVHRALMRLLYLRGDRAAALRQFEACRRLLRHELRVDPMEETIRLRRSIADQEPIAGVRELRVEDRKGPAAIGRSTRGDGPSKESLDTALKELTVAGHLVNRARQRLQAPPRTEHG